MAEETGPGAARRKPGAQPGNTNALKHGYYSRRFSTLELGDLAGRGAGDLSDEISMLRVVIRRTLSLAEEGRAPEELLRVLDTLGTAALRLANLLRAQKSLAGEDSDMAGALNQALAQVVRELEVKP